MIIIECFISISVYVIVFLMAILLASIIPRSFIHRADNYHIFY